MKPIVLIGMPSNIGGACRESADVALLWRKAGIPVTILPVHPIKDNPWPARLTDAGCKIEPPSLNGSPPDWIKDCVVCDFATERATRLWPTLRKRGCQFVHCPTHVNLLQHEHAAFRHWPPTVVVCESEFQRKYLLMQFAAYGMVDLIRIPAAFDPQFFPYQPSQHNGKGFVVGSIGRNDPAKWPPRILRVMKAVKERLPTLRGRLLGWTPTVEHNSGKPPTWVRHLPPGSLSTDLFLADCHALVCFSDYLENAPRVVLESFATGTPVIADAQGGYFEQVRTGETGYLVDSPETATEVLCQLAEDEPLRLRMTEAARSSLTQLAPAEEIAASWMALFQAL